tara:strand:- start:175 stop:1563 length:1389 start_codon:yes stop_codon:yes gene_type:complete
MGQGNRRNFNRARGTVSAEQIKNAAKKTLDFSGRVLGGTADLIFRDATDFDGRGVSGGKVVTGNSNDNNPSDSNLTNLNQKDFDSADRYFKGTNGTIETVIGGNNKTNTNTTSKTETTSSTTASTTASFDHSRTRTYRDRGGLLRYPFEALTEKTDYLQIDIVEYQPASKDSSNDLNFIGRPGSRRIPLRSRIPGGLSTQSLVNKGTVLLQIPSQVQDGNSVNYGDSEMNTIIGAAIEGSTNIMKGVGGALGGEGNLGERFTKAGESLSGAVKGALKAANVDGDAAQSLINKQLASSIVGVFGAQVSVNQILARQEGQIFNPNMELLFDGPTLRNFRFSFKMTPRSEKEAEQCKLIIRTFKMNMAPKVTSGRGSQSLFLNTPNVFQLRYKSGFKNHPFMHKFKQCFLTDISVNYTGEGVYATYENREPVSMIMDLTFKELEPIYDIDYFNDRGRDLDSTVGF